MAKKKRAANSREGAKPATGRHATLLRVRPVAGGNAWEFVPPRCAVERQEDLEEVRKMIEADEAEIAIDELRWLLGGCSDFMDAHKALGELALVAQDFSLARGHFGYAYEIGVKAMTAANCRGPLPYAIETNQPFHESGKGLAFCLKQLNKPKMMARVVETLLRCDPSDPLGVKGFLQ